MSRLREIPGYGRTNRQNMNVINLPETFPPLSEVDEVICLCLNYLIKFRMFDMFWFNIKKF